MLDPSRYALNAETVGFRKRMKLAVPMDSFKKALQTQSESIKVRREIQETPISEVHIMGGQLYGFQGNDKLITLERQQRQINGYPLRSFRVNSGPIFLPAKFGEGYQATPTMMGRVAYTSNATEGNYISKMTEPDLDHISRWNPTEKRKMLMGLEQKYSEMQKNVADWQEKRGFVNQITKQENGQRMANQIRENLRDPRKTQNLERALVLKRDLSEMGGVPDPRVGDVAGARIQLMQSIQQNNTVRLRRSDKTSSNVTNIYNIPGEAVEKRIVQQAIQRQKESVVTGFIEDDEAKNAAKYIRKLEKRKGRVPETAVNEAFKALRNSQGMWDDAALEEEYQQFLAALMEINPNLILDYDVGNISSNDLNEISVGDDLIRNESALLGDPREASEQGPGSNVNTLSQQKASDPSQEVDAGAETASMNERAVVIPGEYDEPAELTVVPAEKQLEREKENKLRIIDEALFEAEKFSERVSNEERVLQGLKKLKPSRNTKGKVNESSNRLKIFKDQYAAAVNRYDNLVRNE